LTASGGWVQAEGDFALEPHSLCYSSHSLEEDFHSALAAACLVRPQGETTARLEAKEDLAG